MKNVFIPFKGLDNISFGMAREEVRAILNDQYKINLKNQFAENTEDYYHNLRLTTSYTKDDILDAIEFWKGSVLLYEGVNLMELKYIIFKKQFNEFSTNKEEDRNGVTYYDLGFGAGKNLETGGIDSLVIFSKDYWD